VLSAPPPAGQDLPVTHTLRAVFTPGHAANHVCLVLEEDELLFSGDHILNGSTPIVNPPDGNMDAYLRSLDTLDAICAQEEIDFILPAHGYVLGAARAVIARLKTTAWHARPRCWPPCRPCPAAAYRTGCSTPTPTPPAAVEARRTQPAGPCGAHPGAGAGTGCLTLAPHRIRTRQPRFLAVADTARPTGHRGPRRLRAYVTD
jgi:hypothetical protein